ncbi:MAG: matrixin family metalloprotease [Planctomycetes bacterium]|nr:matrixin family metalloprotease [Planctomycetota bacterium]
MNHVATKYNSFAVLSLLAAILTVGCQQPPVTCTTNCEGLESEPNNVFAVATRVSLDDGELALSGSVNGGGDIDVFDLGPMSAGDTVRVRVTNLTGSLQPAFAMYDQLNELVNEDTLTSILSRSDSPQINHDVRVDSNPFYMAISHNVAGISTGQYELSVTVVRGDEPPAPVTQILYLNFSGGEIDDPIFGNFQVGPFDASDIDAIYAGQTDFMIAAIRTTIEQNYERFNVTILDSINDGPLPAEGASEILFGGFNDLAFGASQDVDLYNQDTTDKAIIFIESFELNLFLQPPSPAGMSVAIGNVATHETGHLLGMHHVRDADAVMDESSPTFTLLADQEFRSAPLSAAIFPLGNHNAAALLDVIVGTNPNAQAKSVRSEPAVSVPHAIPNLHRAKCLNCLRRNALVNTAESPSDR